MDDKDYLKIHLKDYVNRITRPSKGRNKYACPFCKSGKSGKAGSDGAFSITPNGLYSTCFSCGWSGDLFDLIGAYEHISDFKDIVNRANELYGNSPGSHSQKKTITTPGKIEHYVNLCHNAIFGTLGWDYLQRRGISQDTIEMFKIGYDTQRKGIVIPYPGKEYYTIRFLDPKNGHKYDKPPSEEYGSEPLFICGDPKQTLFICEGQLDAITLAQAGAEAVAGIGGSGYEKLRNKKITRAVYVKDNDEPGEKTAKKIEALLEEIGIPYRIVSSPEGSKDVNEAWTKDPKSVIKLVIAADNDVRSGERSDNVSEYLEEAFNADVEKYIKYKNLKTGFRNLDEVQNFYPGFYVIGAISSLGKTTFTHQLADQIAKAGTPVIIFSLEQNKLELVSKGLARTLVATADDYNEWMTAIQIRSGYSSRALEKAKAAYLEIAKNEYIAEADFRTSMDDIKGYIEDFIKEHKVKPVVIIDYLQIIQPADPRQGTKEAVDTHVKALKSLQSKHELVLVVISSLNRQNYLAPVDFESFKESGSVEYTCDVCWGLQLQCLNEELFNKPNRIIEKRKRVKEAMSAPYREIELVCLKNRYGRSRYTCYFNYDPAHDVFMVSNFTDKDFRPMDGIEKKEVKTFDWGDTIQEDGKPTII